MSERRKQFDHIIYHGGCADGLTAAWIAWEHGHAHALFTPGNYGQDPPDVRDQHVLMVDFCYPWPVLKLMVESAASMTVIDHHKTTVTEVLPLFAIDDQSAVLVQRLLMPIVDESHSGARLTWDYFHPGLAAPPLVNYVEDRDLWRWTLPLSREINAVIQATPQSFETWTRLGKELRESKFLLSVRGRGILAYQNQVVARHVRHAWRETIGGVEVMAVNATCCASEIAGTLAESAPFGAVWSQRGDGQYVYSLRSRPEGMDVEEIARSYGGGGHKHAAGFQVARPCERVIG